MRGTRHVTALGEEGRKGVRWHGDDEVGDGELFDWLNTVKPNRNTPGVVPQQSRRRPRRHRERLDNDGNRHDDQRYAGPRSPPRRQSMGRHPKPSHSRRFGTLG
jgi:hypothetical protein